MRMKIHGGRHRRARPPTGRRALPFTGPES